VFPPYLDDAVELRLLVPQRHLVLAELTRAELPEVLRGGQSRYDKVREATYTLRET
jgi:hypothetical protein